MLLVFESSDPVGSSAKIIGENENVVKEISIGESGFNFPSAGDAVSYIYGTSMLTDIGDLARVCKILRVQTMNFPKLREFNLGHESERDGITYREYATSYIENENGDLIVDPSKPLGDPREFRNEILPNLDCSSMKQLTLLDVTNHTNLSELNIKPCDQLQKLYARGTALKSIEFPATTSLNTVYLGDELTSLTMENLTGITTFKVNSLNNCSKLVIKNCGPVLAKQSYELVTKAINRLEQAHESEPDVCTLHGIDWTDGTATEDMLRRLVNINASLKGKIKLGSMSNELKVAMKNNPLYGNIDDPNSDVLYIEYDQIYIRSVSLPNKIYIHEPGDTQLKFETNPATANTYDYAEWSMIGGSQYATIDASTGSGKTEVYMELIDRVLKMDKTAIMLVPEISLTPQIVDRFVNRFGDNVAILHSGLSDSERYDEYRKIIDGKVRIVVGARSAILEIKSLTLNLFNILYKSTIAFIIVVLPVPGPPVTINILFSIALMIGTYISGAYLITIFSNAETNSASEKSSVTSTENYKKIKDIYEFINKI